MDHGYAQGNIYTVFSIKGFRVLDDKTDLSRTAIIYLFLFKNTPFLEQNAEEMKQDIIVVKLNISKLNKAVFQWTLQ